MRASRRRFCGFVDHTDAQIGRLMDALRELGVFDDTAVIFLSDNGASSEGGQHGTTNTERFRNLMFMEVDEMVDDIDHMGSRHTRTRTTQLGGAKQATPPSNGGSATPTVAATPTRWIIHWPRADCAGGSGGRFAASTTTSPTSFRRCSIWLGFLCRGGSTASDQQPLEGHSFAATITNGDAPNVKATQYYEMLGSRAIWHEGWTAVTWHKPGTDWADGPVGALSPGRGLQPGS